MTRFSRQFLLGALTLILLSSACGAFAREEVVIPVGTILAEDQTRLPQPTSTNAGLAAATDSSISPIIPITGENVVSLQCQFCVEDETHAVLVFPEFIYFDVVSTTPVGCLTADVVNGQRILICRGVQQTSFLLNICSDPTNCLQFPVALQACPLVPATGDDLATTTSTGPIFLVPINTLRPPERDENPPQPANTSVPPLPPTRTSAPSTPTLQPSVATTAPPPTTQPTDPPPQPTNPPPTIAPTQGNGGGGGGEEGGDIVICHAPPGNPENRKTMTVSQSAWQNEHSRHGDSRGPC
jgi:hypothetical protein